MCSYNKEACVHITRKPYMCSYKYWLNTYPVQNSEAITQYNELVVQFRSGLNQDEGRTCVHIMYIEEFRTCSKRSYFLYVAIPADHALKETLINEQTNDLCWVSNFSMLSFLHSPVMLSDILPTDY